MSDREPPRLFDRELSWIAFNGRVLQEAQNPDVPLFERLNFLAIVSSNLDEFFRVRVASLRSLLRLKKKKLKKLGFNAHKLVRDIHRTVHSQQEAFGQTLRGEVLPGLRREGIHLLSETEVPARHRAFLTKYFDSELRPLLRPVDLSEGESPLFLQDRRIYLVVALWPGGDRFNAVEEPDYSLVEVPTEALPRFVVLPPAEGQPGASEGAEDPDEAAEAEGPGAALGEVMFLDDVIRFNLPRLFPDFDIGGAHTVKLSRDADLQIEDEFSGDLVAKIRKSLAKRATGVPSRFLYDSQTPHAMVSLLKERLALEDDDLFPGGRYHNLHDFFSFPRFGRTDLSYEALTPLPHPLLEGADSLLAEIRERDHLLHLPYQSFSYVVSFLREAALDPLVTDISISLYRVAKDSEVARRLIEAAVRGKRVTAFIEVQARFDEASNLEWADRMERAGVRVLYSRPGIKVHTKLALVAREDGQRRLFAYLATGNFNEKTARIYADFGLFTADPRITREAERIFAQLEEKQPGGEKRQVGRVRRGKPRGKQSRGGGDPRQGSDSRGTGDPSQGNDRRGSGERHQEGDGRDGGDQHYQHLLVAPHHMRAGFEALVRGEMARAASGHSGRMILKMNSLEDPGMIALLYEASAAGVEMDLIVRGICRLRPRVPGLSERIRVRSIVDRFLEHARVYVFGARGEERVFIASADWMTRNLKRRVEVAFPVYDEALKREVLDVMDLQLRDNTKARLIDEAQSNPFAPSGEPPARSQIDHYRYLEGLLGT